MARRVISPRHGRGSSPDWGRFVGGAFLCIHGSPATNRPQSPDPPWRTTLEFATGTSFLIQMALSFAPRRKLVLEQTPGNCQEWTGRWLVRFPLGCSHGLQDCLRRFAALERAESPFYFTRLGCNFREKTQLDIQTEIHALLAIYSDLYKIPDGGREDLLIGKAGVVRR